MRYTSMALVVFVVLTLAGCGSASLTEDEATWCREELTRADLIEKGEEIGVDIAHVFERGQEIFDSLTEDGSADEALKSAIDYTESEPNFIKVCRAAYADR